MTTVAEHYRTHLAPVYSWMAGGADAAVARGESEIAAILPDLSAGSSAVDLGAGFGMHAIPLGRRGCAVLAVDSSSLLLEQLMRQATACPVKSDADHIMTCFLEYASGTVDVHDIIHERTGSTWQMHVSVYRKLRLAPGWVSAALEERGLSVRAEPGLAGMIRVIAVKT